MHTLRPGLPQQQGNGDGTVSEPSSHLRQVSFPNLRTTHLQTERNTGVPKTQVICKRERTTASRWPKNAKNAVIGDCLRSRREMRPRMAAALSRVVASALDANTAVHIPHPAVHKHTPSSIMEPRANKPQRVCVSPRSRASQVPTAKLVARCVKRPLEAGSARAPRRGDTRASETVFAEGMRECAWQAAPTCRRPRNSNAGDYFAQFAVRDARGHADGSGCAGRAAEAS